ncbi:MAG: hypothetical protein KBT35_01615 [Firmicutes bacterium]|nr:hypothetical protein [Candidatus Colivicinus equi]
MFWINGIQWKICFVDPDDYILYDYYNDCMTVATTDLYSHTIYIADNIDDIFLIKILKHELYHCYEFSNVAYDLPTCYEELVADFMATYGEELIDNAYELYKQITYYE